VIFVGLLLAPVWACILVGDFIDDFVCNFVARFDGVFGEDIEILPCQ